LVRQKVVIGKSLMNISTCKHFSKGVLRTNFSTLQPSQLFNLLNFSTFSTFQPFNPSTTKTAHSSPGSALPDCATQAGREEPCLRDCVSSQAGTEAARHKLTKIAFRKI
jgi:hypothetical protein